MQADSSYSSRGHSDRKQHCVKTTTTQGSLQRRRVPTGDTEMMKCDPGGPA